MIDNKESVFRIMIKLLIGGSPCTHWSIAQTKNREVEPKGIGWELFKNYLIALKKYNPDYFLYENNKSMSKSIRAQITRELGVEPIAEPIRIGTIENAAKTPSFDSQQYRVYSPDGKSVTICGQGGGVGAKTGLYAVPLEIGKPLTEREMEYMVRETKDGRNHFDFDYCHNTIKDKSSCITANIHKGVPYNVLVDLVKVSTGESKALKIELNGNVYPIYEVRNGQITIKSKQHPIKLMDGFYVIRKLTVAECKRLQTVPEEYIFPVSDTQAYKLLGNGWTVDVIAHIMSNFEGITTKPLEVLSMYDGMSCGHIALDKLGGHIVKYYATEIDKYAIQTTQTNYPDTIQMGDAFQVREDNWKLK